MSRHPRRFFALEPVAGLIWWLASLTSIRCTRSAEGFEWVLQACAKTDTGEAYAQATREAWVC